MHPIRIIGRLDIKGPNVVKGVQLEGLRIVGKPHELATKYYQAGIDEIVYMDVVASLYGRNSILEAVETAAQEIFVPITVGGGIRTVEDVTEALRRGADKVAINTAAVNRPEFIEEAAKAVGSQAIVVSIEAKQRGPGHWEALFNNGREKTGRDVIAWAREAEKLGAGEILLTSVDKEGRKQGFDHALFTAVRDVVEIPVIGCGGASRAADVATAIRSDGLDAVAIAGIFHRDEMTVSGLKADLAGQGIEVRQ